MGEEASLQSSSGITSTAVGFKFGSVRDVGFGRSVKQELGVCRWQIPYATVRRCRCFVLGALGDRVGVDGSLTNTIIEDARLREWKLLCKASSWSPRVALN